MGLKFIIPQKIDLDKENTPIYYAQPLEVGDHLAYEWQVSVYAGGEQAMLDGYSASVYVVRGDGATVNIAGTITGNVAAAELTQPCGNVPGALCCVMRLRKDEQLLTTAIMHCTARKNVTDTFVDPENIIPSIDVLLARIEEMETATATANQAAKDAQAETLVVTEIRKEAEDALADAQEAVAAAEGWAKASAQVEMLPAESEPTVSVETTAEGKVVRFALPRGDTGATPVITFEVETGEAGTQVEIEQTGTAEKPVIKLTIPRGDTGAIEGIAYYDSAPKALGAASAGVSEMVSRGDHTHPMPTASDVGALAKDGTAADSAKLGGVASGQYALKNDIPGEYTLPAATASTLGGVKAGSGMSVASDGTLSGMRFVTILPIATYSTGATLSFSESPYSYTHFFAALNYCGTGFARMSGSAGQRGMVFSSVTCSDSGMLIRVAQISETSAMDNNWKLTRIQQYFISVSGDVELTQPASTQLGVFGIKSY